jgi:hypothetical protein
MVILARRRPHISEQDRPDLICVGLDRCWSCWSTHRPRQRVWRGCCHSRRRPEPPLVTAAIVPRLGVPGALVEVAAIAALFR